MVPMILELGCTGAGKALKSEGLKVESVDSLETLLESDEQTMEARAIVIHKRLLGEDPLSQLRTVKRTYPLLDLVVWAPDASAKEVRALNRIGARDVELTENVYELADTVSDVIESQKILPLVNELQEEIPQTTKFESLRSRSRKMWDLFNLCEQIAPTDTSVMVLGETGTGKELLARAIHNRSGRSGAFVPVNCGAIPPTLIDSELFGHIKGTFTGALKNKEGLFRLADKGTLFLDELGTIPLEVQFRLLRVLQEGKVRPVGGSEEVPVDVRVVAATNAPLEDMVEEGTFREDLYYRLDVIRLMPLPLRERPEDILFLFSYFTRMMIDQYGLARPELDGAFLDQMLTYEWPGNVRELENFAERLILTMPGVTVGAAEFDRLVRRASSSSGSSDRNPSVSKIPKNDIPCDNEILSSAKVEEALSESDSCGSLISSWEPDTSMTLDENLQPVMNKMEFAYLTKCLEENHGQVGKTAEQAGINRRTLLRKLKQHEIDKGDFRR